jgi:hypothetical protein
MGRDSSVGIATRYGLDGPGIESRWGRDFPHPPRPAPGPTQPPKRWVPGVSRGKAARRVALFTHTHLAPRLRKEYSYNASPLWGFVSCSTVDFTFYILRLAPACG